MGKKGKNYPKQQVEEEPKKKRIITEEQLMDKSHMDRTMFIPMLIKDALYPPFSFDSQTDQAIEKITTDINYLLYLDFKNFWATLLYSPILRNSLSTCLSFVHRRWLNQYRYERKQLWDEERFKSKFFEADWFNKLKNQKVYQCLQGLSEALIKVYYRIVSFNLENRELAHLYKIGDQITRNNILDLPKILELIEIYGESNRQIVIHITQAYTTIVPNFYQYLTTEIMPMLFKKVENVLRQMKVTTQKEDFGVNYSYKKIIGRELSPGEEQLKKKVILLLELIDFDKVITMIIEYFPKECMDHCFFNSQVQFYYENIFLELEAAYRVWSYQTQEKKLLNYFNFILKQCIDYFTKYFERTNDILVARNIKSATKEAYVNSLERIFKEYGKRHFIGKKSVKRNLLMYKIIQKRFDISDMLQKLFEEESQNRTYQINIDYLIDFKVILDRQIETDLSPSDDQAVQKHKGSNLNQDEQNAMNGNQEELEQQILQPEQKIDEQNNVEEIAQQIQEADLNELQCLITKRNRSEDYYHKLYQNFNRGYKNDYDDEYDDLVDYDKRPLFIDEESSNSDESQNQKHMVGNERNLQHIKEVHKNNRNYKPSDQHFKHSQKGKGPGNDKEKRYYVQKKQPIAQTEDIKVYPSKNNYRQPQEQRKEQKPNHLAQKGRTNYQQKKQRKQYVEKGRNTNKDKFADKGQQ